MRPGWASSSTPWATQEAAPRLSKPGSRVSAWVIPTNEELMIARNTRRLAGETAVGASGSRASR